MPNCQIIGYFLLTVSIMVILNQFPYNGRTLRTYFCDGVTVALPTRWLRFIACEPRYAKSTVEQYAYCLKDLLVWIDEKKLHTNISIDDILTICSRYELQEWILQRKEEGLSPNTIHSREAAIKEFFDWLTSEAGMRVRLSRDYPYKTGKLISSKPLGKRAKYITKEEIGILLNGFLNESERCLIHFLYDTGLRISEAVNLRKGDLPNETLFPDGMKYYPVYINGVKGRGGNYKERIVILSSPVLARIRRYHNSMEYKFSDSFMLDNDEKPVFLSVRGKMICNRNINEQLKKAADRVGLDRTKYSAHKFRHSAAYSILTSELGNDYFDKLLLTQQVLGHSQISTTEIYASIPPAVLARITKNKIVSDKYLEAKEILDITYLSPLRHQEKRGHH